MKLAKLLNGSLDWLIAAVGGADKFPRRLRGSPDWPLEPTGNPVGVPSTINSNKL